MRKVILTLLIAGCILGCQDNEITQEQEIENLQALLNEIDNLASSERCDNASEWTFTAYGSKACGGPIGYIAYSTEIDVEYFLDRIAEYTAAQEAFNEKWGGFSDCSLPARPVDVICVDGNPTFSF